MNHHMPSNKVMRWLVSGFIGVLLVVCYQLIGYFHQQLKLNSKNIFHSQVDKYICGQHKQHTIIFYLIIISLNYKC
jgi:hypothetical protein